MTRAEKISEHLSLLDWSNLDTLKNSRNVLDETLRVEHNNNILLTYIGPSRQYLEQKVLMLEEKLTQLEHKLELQQHQINNALSFIDDYYRSHTP